MQKDLLVLSQKEKDEVNRRFSENALNMMRKRYLAVDDKGVQETPADMFARVTNALASVEKNYGKDEQAVKKIARDFFDIMAAKEYTPAGRTVTNGGGETPVIANCVVLPIHDSMESIFQTLKDSALLQQAGCGLGFDISEMRPANFPTKKSRGRASGPVTFLKVYDYAFGTIKQQSRSGANMAMMRVDHPDILDFIHCKEKEGEIRNFNISVTVTDEFMEQLEKNPDKQWYCNFAGKKYKPRKVLRHPNGSVYGAEEVNITVKELFDELVKGAWTNGEPGIAFVDTVNKTNPLPGLGPIATSNPCVAGDTFVATERGFMRMEKLVEKFAEGELKILTDQRVPRPLVMRAIERALVGGGEAKEKTLALFSDYIAPIHERGVELSGISRAFQTGTKKVMKLVTKEGYELVATPGHKILTTEGWVEVKDSLGKEVLIQSGEGKFNTEKRLSFETPREVIGENGHTYYYNFPTHWSKELGQVLGWLIGDGWLRDKPKEYCVGFTFSQDDRAIMQYLKSIINEWYKNTVRKEIERANGVYHLDYSSRDFVQYFKNLGVKAVKAEGKEVPAALWEAPREAVIGFLQTLFSADGTVRDNPKSNSSWIALTAKNKRLLQDVQLLLLNLGIRSRIFDRSRPARKNMFPYTKKSGRTVAYTTDGVLYELGIFGEGREKFKNDIGFLDAAKQKKLIDIRFTRFYAQHFTAKVVDVIPLGEKIVYDLTEPITHSMICNGLVIHQCGEQFLHPYDNCNLGSINLAAFVKHKTIDWARLRFVTRTAARLMDNVIDLFDFTVEQCNQTARQNRRIGLGIMGFADMLYQLRIRYDSKEGFAMAGKVMRFINKEAYLMSQELAKEKGTFPAYPKSIFAKKSVSHSGAQQWGIGKKMRNAALTTVAPTGSISMMLDCSSGIEPNFALAYVKQDKDGAQYHYFNSYFEEALNKLKLSQKERDDILQEVIKKGSIQHLKKLPKALRDTFVISMDIGGLDHIRMQAAFQRHVDNSISKTINFPNGASKEEVAQSFIAAWKLGCKSATVYREGSRVVQILNLGTGENLVAPSELSLSKDIKESLDLGMDKERLAARPRPEVMTGKTYRVKTGYGNLYVTVNNDEKGVPFEVFATIGKSGGFFQEQSEAICRIISLCLRAGVKIEEVIKQLKGIRGPMPVFTDKGTILSLPDALGRILEDHVKFSPQVEEAVARPEKQEVLPFVETPKPVAEMGFMPGCPDCGSPLLMSEGCISCKECGFSRCF